MVQIIFNFTASVSLCMRPGWLCLYISFYIKILVLFHSLNLFKYCKKNQYLFAYFWNKNEERKKEKRKKGIDMSQDSELNLVFLQVTLGKIGMS